jgi:phage terminase small subunit
MKTKKGTEPKLNPKQQKFCEQYAIYRNATKAAELAGYSKKTAYSQGQRLLKSQHISTKIASLLKKATKKAEVTLDAVMDELKTIAFSSMFHFASWNKTSVSLIPSEELNPDLLKAVESVGETSGKDGRPQVRIKLHSKLRTVECILRVHELSELEVRVSELEQKLAERP